MSSSFPDVVSVPGHREISVLQLGTVMRQCQSIELGLADVRTVLDILRKTCSKVEEQVDSLTNGLGELKIIVNSLRPSLPVEMVRETEIEPGAASFTAVEQMPISKLAPNPAEIMTPPTPTTPGNLFATCTPSSSSSLGSIGRIKMPVYRTKHSVLDGGEDDENIAREKAPTEIFNLQSAGSGMWLPESLPPSAATDPDATVQLLNQNQDMNTNISPTTPRSSTTTKLSISPSANRRSRSRHENNNNNIALQAPTPTRNESLSRQKTRWDPNVGKRVPVGVSVSVPVPVLQAVNADSMRSGTDLVTTHGTPSSEVPLVTVSGVIQMSNRDTAAASTATDTATMDDSNTSCNDKERSQKLGEQ